MFGIFVKQCITMKAPLFEASAAVFLVKNTAEYRFDIMDGTKDCIKD